VVDRIVDGRDKKVNKMMYNDTRLVELIKYLKPHLSKFVVHNFVARWQERVQGILEAHSKRHNSFMYRFL
jgi:hypothetical protein